MPQPSPHQIPDEWSDLLGFAGHRDARVLDEVEPLAFGGAEG